ncbi:hypothetical protein E3T37_03700 [Cryobacterium sp. TMT2-10]|uniref:hypothetical protein n=1 Tax=Cryobacterium sp. TMT2-10 TaxID=1259244 RepID=UPI00106932FB|nr:hypothetical protein [Cryobacterium sp. TMT2-10]TFD41769.1 hypothetical protein E3T37_03700 [Cryobacterium sp. TMT2-10]
MSEVETISLESVVENCSLSDVSVFELSARRGKVSPDTEEGEAVEPSYDLQIDYRDADNGFRVRLITRFDTDLGVIVSDVGAEYVLDGIGARSIPRDILLDFVNNVALMALVPYVRQSIADITLRVFGSALLMPMIRRGEIEFSEDNAD